jgi:hypothetical protein
VQNGWAPEHNPDADGGDTGGAPQPKVAAHPGELKLLSETKTNVKQLVAPEIRPGETPPVKAPSKGDAILGPL